MQPKACSFTGHRNIEPHLYNSAYIILGDAFDELYSEGVRDFYAGGALGFDTIAARAVLIFKETHPDVKLHLVLPCADQAARWSERDREVYNYLLGKADSVECLSEHYYRGCMPARDRRLVEYADIIIAYHDGRDTGGTSLTLKMAQRLGKRVLNTYYYIQKI